MDKILIMLGDQTSDIKRNLEKNFQESITVVDALRTPQDFADEYERNTLRVNRIIISESAIYKDAFGQMTKLKETLDNFYVQFDLCYVLATKGGELEKLYDFLKTDDNFDSRDKLRLFVHETYTAGLVTEYCLDKIPKRHYVKDEVEFDEIIRVRKSDKKTYKINDSDEIPDATKLVLMDTDTVTPIEIQEKLKNLISSANTVKGEKWENNKILKDLLHLESLTEKATQTVKYEIDYTRFYNDVNLKPKESNIFIVTGERRSGKSTLAYGLAKSAEHRKNKVLLLDFSEEDFGLSFLVENQKDFASVMKLQDFRKDFESALQTLVRNNVKLNIVALNSLTETDLNGIEIIPLLTLIANASQKYFDLVIIDIDLDKLDSIVNLVSNANRLVIAVPSVLTSMYSLFKQINNKSLIELYPNTRKVIVPTSIFNHISKNNYTTSEVNRRLVKQVYGEEIGVISKVQFNSFDITEALITVIESI